QITTFGNMKAKAVVRDVGRVLGMSYAEVDRIAKLIPNDLNMTLKRAIDEEPRLREIIEKNNEVARLKDIAISLEGLSRHASVHAGGVVISDDKPLMDHVPVYVDKKGMLISQYDKKYVERVGLIKFDMLGLKTLTVIHKAVEILHARGVDVDISNLDLDDPEVYSLIGDGDTACVFQLESSGMRQMLRQLKPSKFEDIIAAVALYRPGPMAVIPSYIARKGGREKIEYLHPSLEAILRETYGIIVYQEQVMQIAQVMGGYSLGKADLLRRAMGKKIKKEMAKHRQIFVDGATQKGISEKISSEVFALMEKFAEYGFNKSHAAAYALVSFQTAYLKAHHFNEFMAANLTLDLNDSDKVVKHIAECKAKDVPILSPDINESSWEFVPTPNGIRFGLTAIKNVGQGAVDVILQERQKNGGFKGIEDLIQRVALSKVNRRVIEAMIRVGVFDTLHPTRRALMDVLEGMMARAQRMSRNRQSAQASLFSLEEFEEEENREMEIPDMPDWDNDERLRMEKEGMGFYVSGHPLKRHMGVVKKYTTANTRDIADNTGNVIIAGMLNGLNIMRTRSGETMAKAEVEDLEGSVPVIFFPRTFGQNQEIITSETPVVIRADIKYSVASDAEGETEKEYPELIAQEVYPIDKAREVLSARILVSIKESATISGIVALKDAVSAFKGTCVLSFEVKTQGVVVNIDAGSSYMVDPTKDLVERIKGFSIVNGVEVQ
ncbi:MAG: DNA polymerase III subunit alpha, partial [Thermodesulfobacteriota bacterium]|nr:DNA polymerase III subunit alpha [Thermodesulfobacteriota bacterium]